MIFRNTPLAKGDVTLRANEGRIFFLLVDLKIQSAAIIRRRRNMASIGSAARSHRDLQSLRLQCVHRRDVVTPHAVQIWMLSSFMAKSAGGDAPAPFVEDGRVGYSHRRRQLRIEIGPQ